ncbi:MAG: hypothetical protein J6X36_05900 [Lachnospiraceae bacterium]|nr:hypothetical protein [Lachnospiraceae bacterium]
MEGSARKKLIQVVAILLFIAVSLCCLYKVYDVLRWKDTTGDYLSSFEQLYATADDLIDVAFVGSSHCFCGITPAFMWEEKGIAGFDMSVSGQDRDSAYHHIKELLKSQSPKVIVVDLFALTFDEHAEEGNIYRNLLSMRTSKNSVELVTEYAHKSEWENYISRFPIVHTRYRELTEYDFDLPAQNDYGRGALFQFRENPQTKYVIDEKKVEKTELSDDNKEWLEALIKLSKDENFELEFMILPMVMDEELRSIFDSAERYLEEKGIAVLDYNEISGINIDYATDFADPTHLNSFGSKKVTVHLGEYLSDKYALSDHRGDAKYKQWDDDLTWYYQAKADYEFNASEYYDDVVKKAVSMPNALTVISLEGISEEEPYDFYTPLEAFGMTFEDYLSGGKWLYRDGTLTKVCENDLSAPDYVYDINKKDTLKIRYNGDYLYDENIMLNNESLYCHGAKITIAVYDLFLEEPVAVKGF